MEEDGFGRRVLRFDGRRGGGRTSSSSLSDNAGERGRFLPKTELSTLGKRIEFAESGVCTKELSASVVDATEEATSMADEVGELELVNVRDGTATLFVKVGDEGSNGEGEEVWKFKGGKDSYWEHRAVGDWKGVDDIFGV